SLSHPSPGHRALHSFPTRRSSDLLSQTFTAKHQVRCAVWVLPAQVAFGPERTRMLLVADERSPSPTPGSGVPPGMMMSSTLASRDRKSTRLNSSHDQISYAVFCLK